MSRLRVAVVGCGPNGRRGYMAHLQTFDDVEIVAVCDPVPAARNGGGDEFGVSRRYADVDDLLDSETLDAVFVITPAHLNAPVALRCLERGVNTEVTKPPGLRVAETKALRAAATRTGAKAMVSWSYRFHPLVNQALAMVKERGPVVQVVGEFHKSMSGFAGRGALATSPGRTAFPDILLDNMLMESPIHSIDLLRVFAGSEVAEVHSVVRRACSPYKDVHGALILFENGCLGHLISNYTTDSRLQRYEIHGRDISAYLEGISQGTVFCDGKQHELRELGTGGRREDIRYFLDCVKEDRPVSLPAANLDEAIKTMELAEAIMSGLREDLPPA